MLIGSCVCIRYRVRSWTKSSFHFRPLSRSYPILSSLQFCSTASARRYGAAIDWHMYQMIYIGLSNEGESNCHLKILSTFSRNCNDRQLNVALIKSIRKSRTDSTLNGQGCSKDRDEERPPESESEADGFTPTCLLPPPSPIPDKESQDLNNSHAAVDHSLMI